VLWGGTKPHENHHVAVPPLRFAYDFVVDSAGALHRTDGRSNADYHCWRRPILAPAAGRVVMALDSFAENVPGQARAGYRGPGNFVAIDHGDGEYSVLAHLRRGSVRVATGQEIEAGDTVGECGNNGESVLPHLHYQLQLDPRPGRPVPAPFSGFIADGVLVARSQPSRGQRVIHVARPQGAGFGDLLRARLDSEEAASSGLGSPCHQPADARASLDQRHDPLRPIERHPGETRPRTRGASAAS
jgi:murein DD-endopeptidase MepM/ murein hydrolase activator NlpD